MKIKWFSRGGGIAKCGPFDSQIEATNVLRLRPKFGINELFPPDMFVWPEEVEEEDAELPQQS
jgi:hypothetical protein